MSVCISLTLEDSEMFLSLRMIFSLKRAAVVWAILERISGFDPTLEIIALRYLKFSTSSSLWHFILITLWKPFGLFVITFVLSGPISILYLVVVLSRRSTRAPASSSSSAFTLMSSAKRKLVISRPPLLTLPSWSSDASHMILSRKMSKTLLHQGLSEAEFYGDLEYKFKIIVGRVDFSDQKNYRSLQTYWI